MNHAWRTSSVSEFATTKKLLLEAYSPSELKNIDNVDFNNYYHRNHSKERKILCLLCNITINENDSFEHTKSATHGNNKMFYNLVKQRDPNGGGHFMWNENWVVCRYCHDARFFVEDYQSCLEHVQSVMHLDRVRYCQNKIIEQSMKKKRTAEEQITAARLKEHIRREQLSGYNDDYSYDDYSHDDCRFSVDYTFNDDYSYNDHCYNDGYSYSKKPSYEKKDENMIPTWVWFGLGCIIIWRYFRSH